MKVYSFAGFGAGITQLAECQLPKLNVAGSIPVTRSIFLFILVSLFFSPSAAAQGTTMPDDFWMEASGCNLALDSIPVGSLNETSLKSQLRNGNRSALVPLIRLLVTQGRSDEARVWFQGRGMIIPVTRRDLGIALSWYGRYTLYEILSGQLTIPPDLEDDDYGRSLAGVVAAGWMHCSLDGWFHPDLLVGRSDLLNLSGVFLPSGLDWDKDWIGMNALDSLFKSGIQEGVSR